MESLIMSLPSCLTLLLLLTFSVSIAEANYDFIVRFYEFRNPLGLQCRACESGGQPTCCDDAQPNSEVCTNLQPCVTSFVFLLRPFGKTAQTGVFYLFTRSNGGNSETFNEGPGGFLALSNPFTIINTSEWTGRIQFYIEALDRAEELSDVEVLINSFPIDLELELGAAFTERTTYTGIYNISGLGFDMSFRVQCSKNYSGPNCTTCLVPGYDPHANCAQCLTGRDANTNCTTCLLPGYDPHTNCTQCLTGRDVSTNCTTCISGYDPSVTTTTSVIPAILGGVLGLSVILNIFLIIIVTVVVLVAKTRASSPSLPVPPSSAVNERGETQGTLDIEMKPNSLYGLISDNTGSIVTKPNEVYGVSVPAESSQPETYEYLM